MIRSLKLCGIVVMLGLVAACAQPRYASSGGQPVNGGNAYPPPVYNTGGYSTVPAPTYGTAAPGSMWGTVVRVDNLGAPKDTGTGAVIGAGVGALAGNQIGRSMDESRTTGTVVGAVAGGLIGNAIERNQNQGRAMLRVYLRLDNGSERYWDVPSSQLQPTVGQRLRVYNDQLYTQ